MGQFVHDIYAYNAPNGARLARVSTAESYFLAFRQPEQGFSMGDGVILIHSSHALATAANFHKHNLVKVVYIADDLTETKVGGYFLEQGSFAALSQDEVGGKFLTFSGPNTIYYLDRGMLREQPFSQSAGALALNMRGGANVEGFWTWGADSDGREPGPIMVRGLEEGFYQPGPSGTATDAPLADATWDFNRSVDSAGNAWDATGDEWQVPWDTSILDLLILFIKSGLHWRSGPDLDYSAYNADPGVDRTSAIFAANKVRFAAGVNIVTEVSREITASIERSALLVTGGDSTTAYVTGGSSDVTWIGALRDEAVTGASRLAAAGARNLDAREVQSDAAFPLKHIVEEDELNGGYVPFLDYGPGDLVTIHTGTGAHDYNEFTIPVAAVRIEHDDAGNWFGVPELGAQHLSADSKAFEERANRIIRQARVHTHPEMLCRPGGAAGSSEMVHWHWTGVTHHDLAAYPSLSQPVAEVPPLDDQGQVSTTGGPDGEGYFLTNTLNGDWLPGGEVTSAANVVFVLPVTPGTTYRWSWQMMHNTGSSELRNIAIGWFSGAYDGYTSHSIESQNVSIPTWTDFSQDYVAPSGATGMALRLGGSIRITDIRVAIVTASTAGDGHPDLVDGGVRASRCGHRHDVHRDTAPTVNEDETLGYKLGTIWAQLDSLVTPTEIVGTLMLVDATEGAAVWLPMGTGDVAAEDVSIADAGAYFTGTDVEAALQEIGSDLAAGVGVTDHGALTGLPDDDHQQYWIHAGGGKVPIEFVMAAGSAEAIDITVRPAWDITLSEATCTISATGFTNGVRCYGHLHIRQDGTGGRLATWSAAFQWVGGVAPTLQIAADAWDDVAFYSDDGGTTVIAQHAGTSSGGAATERRILLADGRATPFAFTDMLQMDDGSDFMWSD